MICKHILLIRFLNELILLHSEIVLSIAVYHQQFN